jgi:hypothetical protein
METQGILFLLHLFWCAEAAESILPSRIKGSRHLDADRESPLTIFLEFNLHGSCGIRRAYYVLFGENLTLKTFLHLTS